MTLKNFIVFEGIDGAGTTTQIRLLREKVQNLNLKKNFFFTQEPSSSPTGIFLRSMLKGDVKCTNETAAYLFAADRNEHVKGSLKTEENNLVSGIQKACENGNIVISDRYFFSSLAYQSTDCPPEVPRLLNSLFPLPELLFYFEITPETALKRVDGRGEREIYEKQDFLTKTVEHYHQVLDEYSCKKAEGMKIVKLDATESKEKIAVKIWHEIEELL